MRMLSKCLLNTDRHGTSPASLGGLFQCLTTLIANNFLLTSSLNLPWPSFVLFLHFLSSVIGEQGVASPSPLPLLRKLWRAMSSPLSLLLQTRQLKCHLPVLIGLAFKPF